MAGRKNPEAQTSVLIVDDDEDVRSLLAEYLSARSFAIHEAGSAEKGFRLATENEIDIALIDLHLPGENGLSLCKQLQQGRSTPVIMLTGDLDPTERVIGLEIGADDFISKPFDLREVLARTRSVLRRYQSSLKRAKSDNPFEALLLQSLNQGKSERLLLAIMFCDIVKSTSLAQTLGDEAWTRKLTQFEEMSYSAIFGAAGLPLKWMGDGLLAAFTTPGRALRASQKMHLQSAGLDLDLRIGLHCGECERQDQDLAGIAVHIAARVMSLANPNQTLVTSTVKQLMAGAPIEFLDAGQHELKGISEPWQLYSVS